MYCLFYMTMVLSWEKAGEGEIESSLIPTRESLKVSWEKGVEESTLRKNMVRYQSLEPRGHGGEA